jgi:hypothetical protein
VVWPLELVDEPQALLGGGGCAFVRLGLGPLAPAQDGEELLAMRGDALLVRWRERTGRSAETQPAILDVEFDPLGREFVEQQGRAHSSPSSHWGGAA